VQAILSTLSRARELTARQWGVLLRASFWLLAADLGLRLFGLPRTRALLASRRTAGPAAPLCESEIVRLVDRAARRQPGRATCLRRTLVLQRLLAQEGIATEMRIGVRKENGGLAAHAWLERHGRPLGEPAFIEEKFATLRDARELRQAST
jgi:hypothetical protein